MEHAKLASKFQFNILNEELHPICHLLALLGAHHILHVSRVRVKYRFFKAVVINFSKQEATNLTLEGQNQIIIIIIIIIIIQNNKDCEEDPSIFSRKRKRY